MRTFISVEEARQTVLDACRAAPSQWVDLAASHGRVLAEDVDADDDHPRFDNSAVDGYAIAAEDVDRAGARLQLLGEVQAGSTPESVVGPGTCVRVMTGAPVPTGTAAVVPLERVTAEEEDGIVFGQTPERGSNIRLAGQDVRKGQLVLRAGTPIGSAASGLLAMFGRSSVCVYRRPRVAIVTTGNELVDPGETPGPGQLRNSNATVLRVQVVTSGGEPVGPFHARDERIEVDAAVEAARDADLVVFSGGVSVGRYDLVHEALRDAGMETRFWKVRQRPGKPLLFGLLGDVPVLGLPGNPVSSSVCFDQYARPAIHRMTGRGDGLRPRYTATLAAPFPKPPGLHVFARGVAATGASSGLTVGPTGGQGSHVFSSVLKANCLVHLPADWEEAPAGRDVQIEWTDW